MIGETRIGKTWLLERLLPGKVLNFVQVGCPPTAFAPAFEALTGEIIARRNSDRALIPEREIPNGPFAVDECGYHDPDDVSRALSKRTGCALVFQHWSQVESYQLEDLVKHRNVTVLEIVRAKDLATRQRRA